MNLKENNTKGKKPEEKQGYMLMIPFRLNTGACNLIYNNRKETSGCMREVDWGRVGGGITKR